MSGGDDEGRASPEGAFDGGLDGAGAPGLSDLALRFDGASLRSDRTSSTVSLGHASVKRAVEMLTAASALPEILPGLASELAEFGGEQLRVGVAAALLMLGYELSSSHEPPEVRLAEAAGSAYALLSDAIGEEAADLALQPARLAAIAYCSQVSDVYTEVLARQLSSAAPIEARTEALLALTLLCSEWMGTVQPRRSMLLSRVGLTAAENPLL